MVGGIYCVNMNKIKKAAKILRKAAPSFRLLFTIAQNLQ